jgi:sigma-54 specific flagellar transcriptional regulator A
MLPEGGLALKDYLNDIEKNIIAQALSRTGGNVSKTAQLLQLQRTTLIQKMNKLKRGGDAAVSNEESEFLQNSA